MLNDTILQAIRLSPRETVGKAIEVRPCFCLESVHKRTHVAECSLGRGNYAMDNLGG